MKTLIAIIASFVSLSTSVKADTGKETFKALDGCQRTYVQQMLSDQGLYKSGIDGVWGKGTSKALAQYLKGKNATEVLKVLSKNKACKTNPDRLKYSEFKYKRSNKSFIFTIPNLELIPSKYDDVGIGSIWIRDWLDQYAACSGIKVEDMKTDFTLNFDLSSNEVKTGYTIVGSCK